MNYSKLHKHTLACYVPLPQKRHCIIGCTASRSREVTLALCPALVIPRALCLVSGSQPQERHGHTGDSPAQCHEVDEGDWSTFPKGKAERAGTVQLSSEKAQKKFISVNKQIRRSHADQEWMSEWSKCTVSDCGGKPHFKWQKTEKEYAA